MDAPNLVALVFSVLEVLLEDITEKVLNISSDNDILYYFLTMSREHTPHIQHFVEERVPRYCTNNFRSHFRLYKTTFEVILQLVAPSLIANHEGGKRNNP